MDKSTTVVCDECNAKVTIRPQVEKQKDGRFLDYFICPTCKTRYNVSIISEKGIRFRSRLKVLANSSGTESRPYRRLLSRMMGEIEKPQVGVVRASGNAKASDTASDSGTAS